MRERERERETGERSYFSLEYPWTASFRDVVW
jgi:hypothetical protein